MATSTIENKPGDSPPADPIGFSLQAYVRALQVFGGHQLEALMRGTDRQAVCASLYMSPPYDVHVPALTVSRMSVNLSRARVTGGAAGQQSRSYDSGRYAVFSVPAGVPVSWRKESPSRHLTVYFHSDGFDTDDAQAGASAFEQPLFNLLIPGTRTLVDQLVDELSKPTVLKSDAVLALARLLLVRVARHVRLARSRHESLDAMALLRLREHVMGHLTERILVPDLARLLNLAPYRFTHAFGDLTGQTPQHFVMALRLERATELLRQPQPSLADVAAVCGFANQQHLTNVMHRHLGTTPRRYREQHCKPPVA